MTISNKQQVNATVNKFKNFFGFWNDIDGFSAKDFLMVLFGGSFIIQQFICFILAILGKLNQQVLEVVMGLDTIIITIIGGVFSVQVVQEFKKPKDSVDETDDDNRPVG